MLEAAGRPLLAEYSYELSFPQRVAYAIDLPRANHCTLEGAPEDCTSKQTREIEVAENIQAEGIIAVLFVTYTGHG